MRFTVPGMATGKQQKGKPNPVAAGRPRGRALPKGGVQIYSPGDNKKYARLVADTLLEVTGGRLIYEEGEPVAMKVKFCFARPQSHYTGKGVLRSTAPKHHTQKPDLDNLMKLLKDGMASIWHDDAQVIGYDGGPEKVWVDAEEGWTEVELYRA